MKILGMTGVVVLSDLLMNTFMTPSHWGNTITGA